MTLKKAIIFFFLVLTSSCYQKFEPLTHDERTWLENNQPLKIGVDMAFEPMEFIDSSGNYIGYTADVIKLLSRKLNFKYEIVYNKNWLKTVEDARNGNIDLLPCLIKTPERTGWLNFTLPYEKTDYVILADRSSEDIIEEKELENKRIVLPNNYASTEYLTGKYNLKDPLFVNNLSEAVEFIKSGKAEVTLANYFTAQKLLVKNENLKVAGKLNLSCMFSIGVHKTKPELFGIISKGLSLINDEERAKLKSKWLNKVYENGKGPEVVLLIKLVVFLLLLVVFLRKILNDKLFYTGLAALVISVCIILIYNSEYSEPKVELNEVEENWMQKNPYITLISENNYPPFEFINEDGVLTGISIELINLISQKTGLKFRQLHSSNWDEMVNKALNKEVDIISLIERKKEREKSLLFTDVYLEIPVTIVSNRANSFESLNELKGKNVTYQNGASIINYLKNSTDMVNFIPVESEYNALLDVLFNKSDAAILSLPVVTYFLQQFNISNIYISKPINYVYQCRLGINKDKPVLFSILQKGIKNISKEDKRKLYDKYGGFIETPFYKETMFQVISLIVISFIIILIVSFIYIKEKLEQRVEERTEELEKELKIRQETEIELKKERNKLELYLQISPIMFLLLDRNADLIMVNDKAAEILECPKEDLLGLNWVDNFVLPEDRIAINGILSNTFEKNNDVKPVNENYIVTHKGKIKYISWYNKVIRNHDNKIEAIVSIGLDITEKKESEEKIRELNKELELKNEELEQIVYVTSHDLRTLLVNIQGFSTELEEVLNDISDLLEEESSLENVKTYFQNNIKKEIDLSLGYIKKSSQQMDNLLVGLLHYSRFGRKILEYGNVEMNKLVNDLIASNNYLLESKGIRVEVENLIDCYADYSQINQLFANLISNAIKFSDPGKESFIKISSSRKHKYIEYYVEDNGIGMNPKYIKKIFEIFGRLNPDKYSGEGLGLTIVKKIVEKHNGKISCESEEGTGTKFTLALPMRKVINT